MGPQAEKIYNTYTKNLLERKEEKEYNLEHKTNGVYWKINAINEKLTRWRIFFKKLI